VAKHDFEDHPVRLIAGLQERLDDLEALDDLLPLLDRCLAEHLCSEVTRQRVEVHVAQQLTDGLGAHPDLDRVGAVLLLEPPRLVDGEQILFLHGGDAALEDDVLLEVQDLLEFPQ